MNAPYLVSRNSAAPVNGCIFDAYFPFGALLTTTLLDGIRWIRLADHIWLPVMSSNAGDVATFIHANCRDGVFPDVFAVFDLLQGLIGNVAGETSTEDRISRGTPIGSSEWANYIGVLFEKRRGELFKKDDASRVLNMTSLYSAKDADHPQNTAWFVDSQANT